jgi:predicted histone-like DNA-binding protein
MRGKRLFLILSVSKENKNTFFNLNKNTFKIMIYYTKGKKTLKLNGANEVRYVARIFRSADTSLDTIAEEISVATSLSYPDVVAALKAFEIFVSNHVSNGSAVKFGTLGAFIPAIHSKAMATPEEIDETAVKRITCRFFPSVSFKTKMKDAALEFKDVTINNG